MASKKESKKESKGLRKKEMIRKRKSYEMDTNRRGTGGEYGK